MLVKDTELLNDVSREEADLLDKLDLKSLPQHLAVIMDGNGRWAQKRHLPRVAGHRAGVKAAREIIENCARLKLPCLTLYAFSLENWRRPQAEVDAKTRANRVESSLIVDGAIMRTSPSYLPAGHARERLAVNWASP